MPYGGKYKDWFQDKEDIGKGEEKGGPS